MTSQVARSSSLGTLVLKQVLGEERQERWKAVEKIFKESIATVYGSQDGTLKAIKKTAELRCRLVCNGNEQVGLLAYAKATSSVFSNYGFVECLEIKTMHYLEQEGATSHNVYKACLDEVLLGAKEFSAKSLCMKVARTATDEIQFLEANAFKRVDAASSSTLVFMGRRIEELAPSRKRAAAVSPEQEDQEKTTTTTTSSAESSKRTRRESVHDIPQSGGSAQMASTASSVAHVAAASSSSSSSSGSHGLSSQWRFRDVVPPSSSAQSYGSSASQNFSTTSRSNGTYASSQFQYSAPMQRTNGYYPSQQQPYRSVPFSGYQNSASSTPQGYMSTSSSQSATFGSVQQAPRHHECTLKLQYVRLIQSGQKTVEGRINSGMFRNWRVGDTAKFFGGGSEVRCRITGIVPYTSFEEMLRGEGVGACLPDVANLDAGVRLYNSIPGYAQKAEQNGVLAIRVQLI